MKDIILNTAGDLVCGFLYYDRKEDEDLPRDAIQSAIENNVVTVDEIVERFRTELMEGLGK